METGTVKRFNGGYGFISGDDGRTFFVHHTNIDTEGYRTLATGDRVTFEVQDAKPHPKAVNVRITAKADGSEPPASRQARKDLQPKVSVGRPGRRGGGGWGGDGGGGGGVGGGYVEY